MRGKYSVEWTDSTFERNLQKMDDTSKRKLQMQDGDHTYGHYIMLFAEQLTRTIEGLVKNITDSRNGFFLGMKLGA